MKKLAIDFASSTMTLAVFLLLTFSTMGEADTIPQLDEHLDPTISEALTFDPEKFPEVNCMALNIYYETRGSNLADQYAVADVVLNRVEDTRYPDTICEVVKQGKKYADGSMKRNACQFSWYCDGKSDKPRDIDSWKRAQSIAWDIVQWDSMRGITEGATHYHAHYVNPNWNKSRKGFSITRLGRIGVHIFYRWN
jgi:spore germination cell wall hydrolase CwlJ-like protein